jgi:hypothetical protein
LIPELLQATLISPAFSRITLISSAAYKYTLFFHKKQGKMRKNHFFLLQRDFSVISAPLPSKKCILWAWKRPRKPMLDGLGASLRLKIIIGSVLCLHGCIPA